MANDDRLLVMLEARTADFEKRISRAEKAGSKAFQKMERDAGTMRDRIKDSFSSAANSAGAFAKGLAAPLLALGAAGAVRQIASTANEIARIGDEAKRAGLSVQAFQELKFVAEQNRVGVDALVDGFKELSLRADEFIVTGGGSAAEAFARLGYSAEELNTKLQNPSALFTEIIGKMEKLDQGAQLRIADELFGGTGGEQFVQLIGQGEAGIRATIQAANDLGVVLSSDTIAKAAELDRKFNAVATTVSTGLKQAIVGATAALVDFLDSLPQSATETFAQLQAEAAGFRDEIEQFAQATGRVAPQSEAAIRTIIKAVDDGGLSADAAAVKLREMAKIDMTMFPISTSLNILFGQLERVQAKAGEMAAAIAAASSSPVGAMPSFSDLGTLGAPEPTTIPGSGIPPSTGRGGGGGVSAADREAASVMRLIETLEYEQTTIGLTASELAVANALRDAGSAATEQQRQRIEELVVANFDATASQDAMAQSMEQLDGIAQSVGQSLVDAFSDGKLEASELLDIVVDVISQLIKMPNLAGGLGAMHGGLMTFQIKGKCNERILEHSVPRQGGVVGGRGVLLPDGRDDSGRGQNHHLAACADGDRWAWQAHRSEAA